MLAALVMYPLAAETLRVNNAGSSGAHYTTIDDALAAASDGDVIIVDGSPTSYGDATIDKSVTIQGPGYFLEDNGLTQTGDQSARFSTFQILSDHVTITGLSVSTVNLRANYISVTRCLIGSLYLLLPEPYTGDGITQCVISQNFFNGSGILLNSNYVYANYLEVSNNIFTKQGFLYGIENSTVSRNTFIVSPGIFAKHCVFENNVWPKAPTDNTNSYIDNAIISDELFTSDNERSIKEVTDGVDASKGAFSGDFPYVLSGIPAGAYITSVQMPESVVQGEPLEVTINIGLSR